MMEKRCSKCGLTKPLDDFYRNATRRDGRHSQCIPCKRETDAQDYKVHSRYRSVKDRSLKQRGKLQTLVREYLAEHSCVDCGNTDVRVLEFDHVRGVKRHHVSVMVRQGWSIKSVMEEIAKCEVRCANCHRIRTRETLWRVGELVDPSGPEPGDIVGSKPTAPA